MLTAAVATLLIRFGTLWFGVIIGLIALALVSRRLRTKAGAGSAEAEVIEAIALAEESAPAS